VEDECACLGRVKRRTLLLVVLLMYHQMTLPGTRLLWILTRYAMYVWRNVAARLCKHSCCGKAMSITQPEWVCVCSLGYPACNAHAPYCHLWSVRLYNIFSTLSHKRHDIRKKKVTEHKMCVLIFCTTFVWNISRSKKKRARYDKKIMVFAKITLYSCPILMKLELSGQIF
jgi:hypothetical protein